MGRGRKKKTTKKEKNTAQGKILTPDLEQLLRSYIVVQRQRLSAELRTLSLGGDEILDRMLDMVKHVERELAKQIQKKIENTELYQNFFARVKGVGTSTAAKIIFYVKDIERFPTVSKLWRYAGYGVTNGKADTLRKGEKLCYNPRFKGMLYYTGMLLISKSKKYRAYYEKTKEYYRVNRPQWNKMHVFRAALRKTIKLFLSHLWEVWRKTEGLPVRKPYAIEYCGHTTVYKPEDFFD